MQLSDLKFPLTWHNNGIAGATYFYDANGTMIPPDAILGFMYQLLVASRKGSGETDAYGLDYKTKYRKLQEAIITHVQRRELGYTDEGLIMFMASDDIYNEGGEWKIKDVSEAAPQPPDRESAAAPSERAGEETEMETVRKAMRHAFEESREIGSHGTYKYLSFFDFYADFTESCLRLAENREYAPTPPETSGQNTQGEDKHVFVRGEDDKCTVCGKFRFFGSHVSE